MTSIKTNYKKQLDDIFKNSDYDEFVFFKNSYYSNDEVIENSLLFIGLNPSFRKGDEILEEKFYQLTQENHTDPYFNKFQDISNHTKLPWAHIDMLYCRETKQDKVYELSKSALGTKFIREQLSITNQILEQVNPKIIVVTNSLARWFIGYDDQHWLNHRFEFDKNIGTKRIITEDSKLKGIPIFFTSMLSGQRALDNGSFDRLKWHIDFVNKIENC